MAIGLGKPIEAVTRILPGKIAVNHLVPGFQGQSVFTPFFSAGVGLCPADQDVGLGPPLENQKEGRRHSPRYAVGVLGPPQGRPPQGTGPAGLQGHIGPCNEGRDRMAHRKSRGPKTLFFHVTFPFREDKKKGPEGPGPRG